ILINSKDLLKMITINAANIFNKESDIGSISIGKFADFCRIDMQSPNFFVYKLPKDLFHSYIIQRTNSNNIKQVYIGGNIVFER
ncbi:MAG: amidohydrolase family protein, partial [Candidatus Lokiarchaeota archaeon]